MATSIQVVGGSPHFFKDLDLLAVLSLLDRVLGQEEASPSMKQVMARWKEDLSGYGPGIIDLRIGEMDVASKADLTQLLDLVQREAQAYGNRVPASVLGAHCAAQGVRFFDYPTDLIVQTAARLQGLLKL